MTVATDDPASLSAAEPYSARRGEMSCLSVTQEMVLACQQRLLQQILGQSSPTRAEKVLRDSGLEEQYNELGSFVQKVLHQHESNSILLCGPRGSGKSKVLEAVLASCCPDPRPQASSGPCLEACANSMTLYSQPSSPVIVIRLNGMIHTDDRLALIDMLQQFQVSASMSELLARSPKSFADCLRWLLAIQDNPSLLQKAAPIIFVLDEFDAFTCHPKQTLLYNLFEMVQSRTRTMAVIGLTCRWDAVELLEKRVRSRFSNRQIQFHLPTSIGIFSYIIQTRMSLPTAFAFPEYARLFNAQVEIPAVYELSVSKPYLTTASVTAAVDSQFKDYWMDILLGLSLLELSLLLAAKRLVDAEAPIFNFELVYQEYRSLFTRSTAESLERAPKSLALRAFEYLISIEILQFLTATSQMPVECRPIRLTIMPYLIGLAVDALPNCPAMLRSWISK